MPSVVEAEGKAKQPEQAKNGLPFNAGTPLRFGMAHWSDSLPNNSVSSRKSQDNPPGARRHPGWLVLGQ